MLIPITRRTFCFNRESVGQRIQALFLTHGERQLSPSQEAIRLTSGTRIRPSALIAVVRLLGLLLALTGCQPVAEQEAEHERPAHQPRDFRVAIERLHQLHTELTSAQPRPPEQLDVWQETYDLLRWLPELAAESDLPEPAWNRLDATARQLEERIVQLINRDAAERLAMLRQAESEIKAQLQLLNQIRQEAGQSDADAG
jgi:hypothetical protein